MHDYITPGAPFTAEHMVSRSRFLATVWPVSSEEEAAAVLERVRSEHPAARHVVHAFRLTGGIARQSDDGEPSGTAGKPVFSVLCGEGLYNASITVVRYFGGVLLGTGGLVAAYSAAAAAAVSGAELLCMRACVRVGTLLDYDVYNALQPCFNSEGCRIIGREFSDRVAVTAMVLPGFLEELRLAIVSASRAQSDIKIFSEEFFAF